MTVTWEL